VREAIAEREEAEEQLRQSQKMEAGAEDIARPA
jgi:hypothetical protein